MKRGALLLVLAACKKDAPPAEEPSNDQPVADLTCESVAENPLIAEDPAMRDKFLDYCHANPDFATPAMLRCIADATSRGDLDLCEDGPEVPAGEPMRSEAELALDAIKQGAKAWFAKAGVFLEADHPLTPATPCCQSGRDDRACFDPDAWKGGVWFDYEFAIDEPHFYQYSYVGTETEFTAIAVGDLDCDDTFATYTLVGRANDGAPVYELTRPEKAE